MGQKQQLIKPYPLRLEPELNEKIKLLAQLHRRSYNKEIENIVAMFVESYEKDNGLIERSILESTNKTPQK